MTPLHFAVVNNQYEICSMLLASGINKDAKTKVDRTSLHLACYHGHLQIVELLLLYNCAVNPRDMVGQTKAKRKNIWILKCIVYFLYIF